MSTLTGDVLPVDGCFDFRALCLVSLKPGPIVSSAEKALFVWLILEEIMVNS